MWVALITFLRFWSVLQFMCTVQSWLCSIRAWWPVGHYQFCSWMTTRELIYFSYWVLMKQMRIQQREAFLLSSLTPVPKKDSIYFMKELVGIIYAGRKFSHKYPQTVPLIKRVFSAFSIVSLFCNPIIYTQYEQYMLVYQLWVTCWLLNHGSSFFFQKKN